jgi:hypothetical protein
MEPPLLDPSDCDSVYNIYYIILYGTAVGYCIVIIIFLASKNSVDTVKKREPYGSLASRVNKRYITVYFAKFSLCSRILIRVVSLCLM